MADEQQVIAAEPQYTPTPMGVVWLVVLLTMLVTGGVTLLWSAHDTALHIGDNEKVNAHVKAEIVALTAYRDILQSGGKAAGTQYLETHQPI